LLDDSRPPLNKSSGLIEERLALPTLGEDEDGHAESRDGIALVGTSVVMVLRNMNVNAQL